MTTADIWILDRILKLCVCGLHVLTGWGFGAGNLELRVRSNDPSPAFLQHNMNRHHCVTSDLGLRVTGFESQLIN